MKSERILSIDIFRGLTIFMMVFVNELAAVSGIPAWMKHVPTEVNGMTFVDVVFPAFLFIVGMSIPFAVQNRLSKDSNVLNFWKHALIRTGGLLILGVYMVNAEEMNVEANPISKSLWSAALYISAILIWNRYPRTEEVSKKRWQLALRILGAIVLLALFFLYRKGVEGALTGMTPSWWGILGLIGWAYLISLFAYMATDKQSWGIPAVLGAFTFLVVGLKTDFLGGSSLVTWLQGQTGHMVHSILVMAGIICSFFLRQEEGIEKAGPKIRNMLIAALLAIVVGYVLEPVGGISKNKATLSWAFYSAGSCYALFAAIYWIVDVKGQAGWANFVKPAGTNPLLTYILPGLFYAIVGYGFIPEFLNVGFGGIIRSLVFSFFILFLADQMTKRNIRLQL